jgi:MarR family transcriptional regulator, organic hydroperoxide resistance regulator
LDEKDIIKDLMEIEMRMLEVKNLFSGISTEMVKNSVGIMGFAVNMSQLKAMTAFSEDSLLSMGELCKMANIKMPSMTEAVDRFEKEGILDRIRDDKDRRVVKVKMTEKGKKMHKEVLKKRADELTKIFGVLTTKDRTKLVDSLKNVSEILIKVTENKQV